ncbi:uncharacterized protein EV422DRAFT_253770 [Fimicolochytrium jonesii]|uniref:uncharacterized protein n=1 Tax=Fimicolochytrium jonesii TaxID=1396493 RepID=UPI0022FF0975|nr:uncharacterized protein EV422DRAFT_253770 [Fimicolochytrium jonesii]KAI8825288.1 hypothetical protein EV422DRAFT_253770 [Fimicolochytrium jonesii]
MTSLFCSASRLILFDPPPLPPRPLPPFQPPFHLRRISKPLILQHNRIIIIPIRQQPTLLILPFQLRILCRIYEFQVGVLGGGGGIRRNVRVSVGNILLIIVGVDGDLGLRGCRKCAVASPTCSSSARTPTASPSRSRLFLRVRNERVNLQPQLIPALSLLISPPLLSSVLRTSPSKRGALERMICILYDILDAEGVPEGVVEGDAGG